MMDPISMALLSNLQVLDALQTKRRQQQEQSAAPAPRDLPLEAVDPLTPDEALGQYPVVPGPQNALRRLMGLTPRLSRMLGSGPREAAWQEMGLSMGGLLGDAVDDWREGKARRAFAEEAGLSPVGSTDEALRSATGELRGATPGTIGGGGFPSVSGGAAGGLGGVDMSSLTPAMRRKYSAANAAFLRSQLENEAVFNRWARQHEIQRGEQLSDREYARGLREEDRAYDRSRDTDRRRLRLQDSALKLGMNDPDMADLLDEGSPDSELNEAARRIGQWARERDEADKMRALRLGLMDKPELLQAFDEAGEPSLLRRATDWMGVTEPAGEVGIDARLGAVGERSLDLQQEAQDEKERKLQIDTTLNALRTLKPKGGGAAGGFVIPTVKDGVVGKVDPQSARLVQAYILSKAADQTLTDETEPTFRQRMIDELQGQYGLPSEFTDLQLDFLLNDPTLWQRNGGGRALADQANLRYTLEGGDAVRALDQAVGGLYHSGAQTGEAETLIKRLNSLLDRSSGTGDWPASPGAGASGASQPERPLSDADALELNRKEYVIGKLMSRDRSMTRETAEQMYQQAKSDKAMMKQLDLSPGPKLNAFALPPDPLSGSRGPDDDLAIAMEQLRLRLAAKPASAPSSSPYQSTALRAALGGYSE